MLTSVFGHLLKNLKKNFYFRIDAFNTLKVLKVTFIYINLIIISIFESLTNALGLARPNILNAQTKHLRVCLDGGMF